VAAPGCHGAVLFDQLKVALRTHPGDFFDIGTLIHTWSMLRMRVDKKFHRQHCRSHWMTETAETCTRESSSMHYQG
jgi:hypothetical protein